MLANRFNSYRQTSSLSSGDRSGHVMATRLNMLFKSFRGPDRKPLEGDVLSKSLARYTHPFEVRHSGYLIINKLDKPNDQFLYRASARRVQRVSLRGEAVFGTDFSFEDVIPREVEDATYFRMADVVYEDRPCFTVRAVPNPQMASEYAYFDVTIEKDRYLPLRTYYYDETEEQIKELVSPSKHIELINEVWVPMQMTMTHLKLESHTTLQVLDVQPNIQLARTDFDLRRLEAH